MTDLLKRAIVLKNRIAEQQYAEPLDERTEILKEFGILLNQTLPDKVSKIFPFQKKLKKRQHQVFNFLFHHDVTIVNQNKRR